MTPIKKWCADNHIGLTTAYKFLNIGLIEAVKVGNRTFITDEADRKFKQSLPKYKNGEA